MPADRSYLFPTGTPVQVTLGNLTYYARHDSDHLGRLAVNRLHRRIRWLKPNAIRFGEPVFQRRFTFIGDRHDDIAFVRGSGAAANHDIAIRDLGLDHR